MTNIALLGFGVVGGGVADVIATNNETIARKTGEHINIKYILDLREFPDHPLGGRVVHDMNIILNDPEVTVVAEMMGGAHPAYDYTRAALEAGKHVVTSNKEVVATFGAELLRIAKEHHVRYLFEASVGGGIPVIRPMSSCLAANELSEVDGILNGTTNYILTQMIRAGKTFEEALAEAQEKGYAERNPAADVEGTDACRKICILSALAFGRLYAPASVHTEGITAVTAQNVADAEAVGGVIKLIGRAGRVNADDPNSDVFMLVSPHVIPHENPLSCVDDVFNAILVRGNAVGDVMFYGRGAGNLPTASAVVADIIDIMTHKDAEIFVPDWESAEGAPADYTALPYAFLCRLQTEASYDDTAAALRAAYADVELLTAKDAFDGTVAFVTPITTECALRTALAPIGSCVSMLRIMP
ncbi:MAG: homoserine dehydrogenase [Clostridia bacterium]|nr:homoserine dehydrogenase [Clostridia bacterium]